MMMGGQWTKRLNRRVYFVLIIYLFSARQHSAK